MKMSMLDRILLLATGLLAAYQIVVGINDLSTAPIIAYTIAFGVLLVAGLLLIILGFDVLDSPVVVIVSTVIPLALSLGLVWEHLPAFRTPYLVFAMLGFLAVVLTRTIPMQNKLPTVVIAVAESDGRLYPADRECPYRPCVSLSPPDPYAVALPHMTRTCFLHQKQSVAPALERRPR